MRFFVNKPILGKTAFQDEANQNLLIIKKLLHTVYIKLHQLQDISALFTEGLINVGRQCFIKGWNHSYAYKGIVKINEGLYSEYERFTKIWQDKNYFITRL